MAKRAKTYLAKAKSWAARNGLHGSAAFSKYVMLTYMEHLCSESNEFIFKGGNLLWVYIGTPRVTVDLDFVTNTLYEHEDVKSHLEAVCSQATDGIKFSLKSFKAIERENGRGAAVRMKYRTEQGQENTFDIDAVYAVNTLTEIVSSPIDGHSIQAAAMENIIADKLDASHSYVAGNTRMKDFDDLWRISKSKDKPINWQKLKKLLTDRMIKVSLNKDWITDSMRELWRVHASEYEDLPKDLNSLFEEVNLWFERCDGES